MMQKKLKNDWNPWHMGTHLKVLSESYPMNTNVTGFRSLYFLALWVKVASALKGLTIAIEERTVCQV